MAIQLKEIHNFFHFLYDSIPLFEQNERLRVVSHELKQLRICLQP